MNNKQKVLKKLHSKIVENDELLYKMLCNGVAFRRLINSIFSIFYTKDIKKMEDRINLNYKKFISNREEISNLANELHDLLEEK